MEIYIKNGEKRDGPFSIEALQGMLNEGKLSRTSLAIHEGLSNWIPLAAVLTPRTGPPPYRPKGATTTVGTTRPLAPVAPPLIPGQSERQSGTGRRYYYILEEKQQGPVSEPDFRHIFDSGALPMTTPVWSDGMEGWEPAAVVMSSVPKVTEQPISMKRDSVEEPVPKALPFVSPLEKLVSRKLAWVLGMGALLVILYYRNADSRWTNTLGMQFVKVSGTYVMFSIWDTRVSDYRAYAKANSGIDQSWKEPDFRQTADHPVVNVSWEDAQAFCAWLTKKERAEGKIKADQRYRLPTDAEWSVAVGLEGEAGGAPKDKNMKIKGVYPWGTQWPPPKGAGNYAPSLGVDDYEHTSPVGRLAPNKYGLYDMGGNVEQWCDDRYDGDQKFRVLRGASWVYIDPDYLLSSNRFISDPDDRCADVGFRCVLVGGGSL